MKEKTFQAILAMPFALMIACIGAVIGLLLGIFYALVVGAIFAAIPSTTGIGLGALSILFVFGAIICFIGGLIEGLIIAVIYYFLAPRIGGIKLRFKEGGQPPLITSQLFLFRIAILSLFSRNRYKRNLQRQQKPLLPSFFLYTNQFLNFFM